MLSLTACDGCDEETSTEGPAVPQAQEQSVHGDGVVQHRFIEQLPQCDIDHRGQAVDMGTEAEVGRLAWRTGKGARFASREYGGATWAEVFDKRFDISIWLPEPARLSVGMRAISRNARAVVTSIDGATIGTLRLNEDQDQTVETDHTTFPVDAGFQTITFRFLQRGARDEDKPYAEIDWIRFGHPDDVKSAYGAPVLSDVVLPRAALGGTPHSALGLRVPGAVRCATWVPPYGRLRTKVGYIGDGEAKAEIRVLRDQQPPVVVHSSLAEGGNTATWKDVDVDLAGFAGELVAVELAAPSGTSAGRLAYGDPEITVPLPTASDRSGLRGAIVVVLSGVLRHQMPGYTDVPQRHLPTLTRLSKEAARFDSFRLPATTSTAVVASLITGLPPPAHGVYGMSGRLSERANEFARLAHAGGAHAAMFTAVPSTFEAQGFQHGWERFEQFSPVSGESKVAVFERALAWIDELHESSEDPRFVAFLHSRGSHPPWSVPDDVLLEMPPADYTGVFKTPRLAAQAIANLRGRRGKVLDEADLERGRALASYNLSRQDLALGELIDELEERGLWDQTLFVVMGDVPGGIETLYEEGRPLEEDALQAPLYVRFPDNRHASESLGTPMSPTAIHSVVKSALGLSAEPMPGYHELLTDPAMSAERLQIAWSDEHYAVRAGRFVLYGERDGQPRLCDAVLDPACATDRDRLRPLATATLFRNFVIRDRLFTEMAGERLSAKIDDATSAALLVWGASE